MNDNTGLPELPEGFFFKIYTHYTYGQPEIYVGLYKEAKKQGGNKLQRIFFDDYKPTYIDAELFYPEHVLKHSGHSEEKIKEVTKQGVLKLARKLMDTHDKEIAKKRVMQFVHDELVGNYPPKKMEI